MSIDFHDPNNRLTYASRTAEHHWLESIQRHVVIEGKEIADIGCGGGIYTKVLALAGAIAQKI